MQIAVVNNSDSAGATQSLQDLDYPGSPVCVLTPETNLGYFGGAAWGLEILLKKGELPEWVAVSNADIVPSKNDFLQTLQGMLDGRHGSVIAPAIVALPSKQSQNPYLRTRPSNRRMRMYAFVYSHPLIYAGYDMLSYVRRRIGLWRTKRLAQQPTDHSEVIYAPYGAFILFHRSYFERGGTLDFGSFLFGEEIYVAERARQLDLEVRYEPSLSLVHHEHVATGLLGRRRITHYVAHSTRYLLDEFFTKK